MIYKDSIVLCDFKCHRISASNYGLCTQSLENDRVELSDTLAVTLWTESSRNPAAVTFKGIWFVFSFQHCTSNSGNVHNRQKLKSKRQRPGWTMSKNGHSHTHLLWSVIWQQSTLVWFCSTMCSVVFMSCVKVTESLWGSCFTYQDARGYSETQERLVNPIWPRANPLNTRKRDKN